MPKTINVKPTADLRREFARWAVQNHVRTQSQNSFAVPEDLFPEIPEQLLAGAAIDGQAYISDGSARPEYVIDDTTDYEGDDLQTDATATVPELEPELEPEPETETESVETEVEAEAETDESGGEADTGTSVPF